MNFHALLVCSAVIGCTGSVVSLAISRIVAKKMMGVQVIDPVDRSNHLEALIVEKVYRLSRAAGLTRMPEVGIYKSNEVNAFATGPTKTVSLVAGSPRVV